MARRLRPIALSDDYHDLNYHGVFSNGVFDIVDGTVAVLPPGIFLSGVSEYCLSLPLTKIDARLAQAGRLQRA